MFEFRKVDQDKQLLDEIYRLRYKVYCDEWGFEKPEDHPDGIEIDDYDKHSAHFAAFWEDGGSMIGTVRLIRSSESGFPLFRHCTVDADLSFLREDAMGEISRLAISKELRRRRPDRALYDEDAGIGRGRNTSCSPRTKKKRERDRLGPLSLPLQGMPRNGFDASLCGNGTGAFSVTQEDIHKLQTDRPRSELSWIEDPVYS